MWSYGVKHAGAAQAAMIQNLTPIVAMAAAWIWLGETINTTQALGGAMIIGGLFVMRRSRQSSSQEEIEAFERIFAQNVSTTSRHCL